MRAQVKKLRDDLFIARRLEWMREGIDPTKQLKGGQLLMQRAPVAANAAPAAGSPHYNLNVEVGSDGSVHVIPPLTNAPTTTRRGRQTGGRRGARSVRKLPMPTYEYICEKCGHEFEAVQSISAKPLRICPQEFCARKKWGRGRVKKKISAGAGSAFQGQRLLHHRLPQRRLQTGGQKGFRRPATAGGEAKPAKDAAKPAPAKAESKAAKK